MSTITSSRKSKKFKIGDIVTIGTALNGFQPELGNMKSYPYFEVKGFSKFDECYTVKAVPQSPTDTRRADYLVYHKSYLHSTDIDSFGNKFPLLNNQIVCVNSFSRREYLNLGFVYTVKKAFFANGQWRVFLNEVKENVHFSAERFLKMPEFRSFSTALERQLVTGEDVFCLSDKKIKTVVSVNGVNVSVVAPNTLSPITTLYRIQFISVVDLLLWLGKDKAADGLAAYYDGLVNGKKVSTVEKKIEPLTNTTETFKIGDVITVKPGQQQGERLLLGVNYVVEKIGDGGKMLYMKDSSGESMSGWFALRFTKVSFPAVLTETQKKIETPVNRNFKVGDVVTCNGDFGGQTHLNLTKGRSYIVKNLSGFTHDGSPTIIDIINDAGKKNSYMAYRFDYPGSANPVAVKKAITTIVHSDGESSYIPRDYAEWFDIRLNGADYKATLLITNSEFNTITAVMMCVDGDKLHFLTQEVTVDSKFPDHDIPKIIEKMFIGKTYKITKNFVLNDEFKKFLNTI